MFDRFPHVVMMMTLVGLSAVGLAQGPALPQPMSSSVSTEHDFDFLLGDWEFAAASKVPGVPPKYQGRWTGERIGDGTLVEDDFTALDDRGNRVYLGVTVRAFDAKAKHWTTAFVEPVRYLEGPVGKWSLGIAWRDGTEVRESPLDESNRTRAHFFDIAPDHFSWRMDRCTPPP